PLVFLRLVISIFHNLRARGSTVSGLSWFLNVISVVSLSHIWTVSASFLEDRFGIALFPSEVECGSAETCRHLGMREKESYVCRAVTDLHTHGTLPGSVSTSHRGRLSQACVSFAIWGFECHLTLKDCLAFLPLIFILGAVLFSL
ncbi:hypothetical protein H1C71_001661, partial [Ictidomys tridecemlineatus]